MKTTAMRFDHLHLTVSDLGRSTAFYRDHLGLHVGFEDPGNMVEFDQVAVILDQAKAGTAISPSVTVGIRVDDVDAMFTHLQTRDVSLGDPPQDQVWGVRNFYFTDPDGYTLEIVQPLVRTA